jgi:pimeloyl-ACP methyl ester carboxylesterase
VMTDLGTVHAYEWSSPEVTDAVPVVLIPGRASGVPMWSENLPGFLKDRRVIAFDALGDAGLSVQGAPMDSFDDQALWMKQVLAELARRELTSSATPSEARLQRHTRIASPTSWSR